MTYPIQQPHDPIVRGGLGRWVQRGGREPESGGSTKRGRSRVLVPNRKGGQTCCWPRCLDGAGDLGAANVDRIRRARTGDIVGSRRRGEGRAEALKAAFPAIRGDAHHGDCNRSSRAEDRRWVTRCTRTRVGDRGEVRTMVALRARRSPVRARSGAEPRLVVRGDESR